MGRAKVILQSEFPYGISGRCVNRDRFQIPLPEVWQIFCEELYMATILHNLRVHSFVLLSNHFHLIASTPDSNISQAMRRFMEATSKRVGERSYRINQIWGSRHYKTVLGRYSYYLNAYKYFYFNPVKAGMVSRCEDYRFSTLRALLGLESVLFPIVEDSLLLDGPEACLSWLNSRPSNERWNAIRASLRKSQFQHVKCEKARKPILLEDEVI